MTSNRRFDIRSGWRGVRTVPYPPRFGTEGCGGKAGWNVAASWLNGLRLISVSPFTPSPVFSESIQVRIISTSFSVNAPNILPFHASSFIRRLFWLFPRYTHGLASANAERNCCFQSTPSLANSSSLQLAVNQSERLRPPILARLVQWILRARPALRCNMLATCDSNDSTVISLPQF